jgi:hypothetical protein
LNGERALLQVERLILTAVNVRGIATARRDNHLGHEEGAASLLTCDEKPNLIDGAAIGLACSRRHVLE